MVTERCIKRSINPSSYPLALVAVPTAEEETMAAATTEQGPFESANMVMPNQPMTAEGKAAQENMEATEARRSEEKAYDEKTKGKYTDLYGSLDSSDDDIQQRRTADQRRLETEEQATKSGFGMQEMGMMFKEMMAAAAATAAATAVSQAAANREMMAQFKDFAMTVSSDPNRAHQPRQEERTHPSRISENKLDL